MNTDPSEPQAHLQRFLDWAYARFQGGDIFATMQELISYLSRLRGSVDEPTWNLLLKPTCLCHRLKDLVHEDPYTFRAFRKPRGYSGDTVMLDYVYSQKPPPGTTPPWQGSVPRDHRHVP